MVKYRKNEHLGVVAYTDAGWVGSFIDQGQLGAIAPFLVAILLLVKIQNVVARSSVEAEFLAVAHGNCELLWVKRLLDELKIPIERPMRLYCDNKTAINIAHNLVQHDRTKHVEVHCHLFQ